jgi:glutaredoxin 3
MVKLELFGSTGCPYTREMRDWLEWRGAEFVEYDVEVDAVALHRLRALAGGQLTIPVLVDDGRVVRIGWQGRGCVLS